MARPWPSSPVFLICDSEMCPKMMPSGANRNAQTSDAIAMPLVGRGRGWAYGSYGGGYAPYGGGGGTGALTGSVQPDGLDLNVERRLTVLTAARHAGRG